MRPLSAPRNAGRCDIREHEHLLVGQVVGNLGEIRAGVRHEQVFRPRAINRVAEAPSAQGAAALGARVVQAIEALTAGSNRPDDDAVADLVLAFQAFAECLDDADRLMAKDQALAHGVFTLDDVDVGAANGRGRDADDGFAGARSAASAPPRFVVC